MLLLFTTTVLRGATLGEPHLDVVAVGDLEPHAHEVGRDGQLAPAAIHEHREPDAPGPPEVDELVERGADGAPGVEHVVDEQDRLALHREPDVGRADDRRRALLRDVVTVERDVERPEGRLDAEASRELRPEALGEEHPAAPDPYDGEVARGARRLRARRHVVREPADGALQLLCVHTVLHQRSGPQFGRSHPRCPP